MIKLRTKNEKIVKSWKGRRCGSISRTPVLNCPGAPKGGCKFCGRSCYALNLSKRYTAIKTHWKRVDALGELGLWSKVAELIRREKIEVFRPFTLGGDFTSQRDVAAFFAVASMYPDVWFYAYSKSMCFDLHTGCPSNCVIIQSEGGRFDHLIDWGRPVARVFRTLAELKAAGYENCSMNEMRAGLGTVQRIGLLAH